jgi:hypothetical protein
MKSALTVMILLVFVLSGCATAQHHSALRVVRAADATLSTETTATGFERRLAYLRATFDPGTGPGGSRSVTFLTPPPPGGFPPRRVQIIYTVTDDGLVRLQSATILSLMVVDHQKA